MDFYISPHMRETCERRMERMFKHWAHKPKIEYSPIEKVVKTTTIVTTGGFDYENGHRRYKETFDAIKVTIEDLTVGEWTLVAEVCYIDQIVGMVDKKLFKHMPKHFGLEYKTCDYCGGTRDARKKSYVLYNNVTKEWKQVGSSCVNKMIANGRYINNIALKLHECFIEYLGGTDDFGWDGGCWRPTKDESLKKAIPFCDAITLCEMWIKENGNKWEKAEWNRGEKVKSGTNDKLIALEFEAKEVQANVALYKKICKYYDGKEGGYNWDGEPDLTSRIKEAIEAEYINVRNMYLAFFALKTYMESLTYPDFVKAVEENGITKDAKYTFVGKLDSIEKFEVEDYYYGGTTYVYDATLIDSKSGLAFLKSISYQSLLDKYKIDDDTYAFECKIGYVDNRRRLINIRGRVSKCKKTKYINT